jgi:predicted dehydrogenase
MARINTAMIGTGFMGKVHTEQVRRLGNVEVAAIAGSSPEKAAKAAKEMNIERAAASWEELCKDPEIQAVHICTPNVLHYPQAKLALEHGKHVLCEKPLTMNTAEAKKLLDLAEKKGLVHCIQHNLRNYPMVRQAKAMIEAGDIGEILVVQGTYSQDWLLYDTDYNWRIEAESNGELRAMGDIGSHWMDSIQFLTGLRIGSVCADLTTFHKTRKKPKGSVETFTGKKAKAAAQYEEIPITTDDFGMVLLTLGERAKGAFTVSQVSAGNKNGLRWEIYGTKGGLQWNQERPDELWVGRRNDPNQIVIKDPSMMKGGAAAFADLPGGHSEGYDDSHKQMFKMFYGKIANPKAAVEYPTFADGLHGMKCLEAVLKSHKARKWVNVAS